MLVEGLLWCSFRKPSSQLSPPPWPPQAEADILFGSPQPPQQAPFHSHLSKLSLDRGPRPAGCPRAHPLWLHHAWPGMEQTSANVCRIDRKPDPSGPEWRTIPAGGMPACSQLSVYAPVRAHSHFSLARASSPFARTSSPLALPLALLSSLPPKPASGGFTPQGPVSSSGLSVEDSSPPQFIYLTNIY